MRLGLGIGLPLGGDAAGESFNPLSLSPLQWLNVPKMTGLNNGDESDSFTDFSGNGFNYTCSPTLGAIYRSAGINGLPALEGDGINTDMQGPLMGAQSDWWAFIVLQSLAGGFSGNIWSIVDYPSSAGNFILLQVGGSGVQVQSGLPTTGSVLVNTGSPRGLFITGSSTTGVNIKSDDGSTGSSGNGNGSRQDIITRLFNRGDGHQNCPVRIGEVLFGADALDSATEAKVWKYLTRWGTGIP